MTTRVENVVRFYQALTPDSLAGMRAVYAEDAYFRDPFNEVRGIAAIEAVFHRMFEQLLEPRFRVTGTVADAGGAMLEWEFDYRMRAWQPERTRTIRGVTHLRFAADGRVCYHRDYWDAAAELYEQLPLIGAVLRWLRRRMG